MNRFRKWSDARSSQFPESIRSSTVSSRSSSQPSDSLPPLPPVGDFRTSLILPDLSRRFTFLRAASGEPVSLDDLKSRLADQRARGAENHLSEEEADMFLQTISRLRSKASTSSTSGDSTHGLARESLRSNETTSSFVNSSPASTKRYSNNMFGSGKFRDYTYMRSVTKERTGKVGAGRRSTNSALLSASGHSYKMSDPPIPEDSSQTDVDLSHDSDTTPLASGVEASPSELEQGIVKTFQPSHVRRVSMAMEEVIREIEEEADGDGDGDDKILIPRAAAPERASSFKRSSIATPRPIPPPSEHNVYETGTAVSPDPYSQTDAAEFRSTPSPYPRAETSPAPRLPGYIPGMPRPMTPREATFDPDELSPSSTPRATSPRIPDRATSPSFTSGIPRRDSTSTRQLHRTSSPPPSANAPIASVLSGVNGRYTPDGSRTPDGSSVDFGNPFDSSLLGRRRPVSPFSQGTFQSMTMSSRPSTPSNVTWKASSTSGNGSAGGSRSGSAVGFSESDFSSASGFPSPPRNGFDRTSAHKRNDSSMSSNELHEFAQLNRSGSVLGNRSLRSPTLPESPSPENQSQSLATFTYPKRSQPSAPSNDLGSSSPQANAALRSSTPTQYAPRSPGSPAFFEHDVGRNSRLSSRQATASPYMSQTPILSPLANSSRSSLESAGSSYHTWEADKQDRTLPVLAALEPQPIAWHDISVSGGDSSSPAEGDVEEIVQQYAGLSKVDFVAIQQRLLLAAKLKAEAPEPRERRNSLKRRRPSTSQAGRDNGATDSTQQGSPPRASFQDSAAKASALLDSVVDSIQAPRPKLPSPPAELRTDVVSGTATDPEPSSATRRKNALARALFGASDSEQSLTSPSPLPTDGLSPEQAPQIESSISSRSLRETSSSSSPNGVSSSSATEQRKQELAMEVQRKAEAAMAQLKKTPSTTKVNDSSSKKRIDPSQISGPKLVSASTSVDTIPVRSPSSASGHLPAGQYPPLNSSKLGSRFKKFRGSLRAKSTLPSGDGSTPHPFDQTSSADRSLAGTPDGPPPFSATEPTRPKVIPPSQPVAAGPGLKGFVSRFLKPRSGDTLEHDRRKQQIPTTASPAPPSYFYQQQTERYPEGGNPGQIVRSAPPENKSFRPHTPVSPESPPRNPPPSAPPAPPAVRHGGDTGTTSDVDDNALKQFIDAANNLGLDQAALTEFLNRSTSMSSRRLTAQSSKHMSESSDKIGHDKSNPTLGDAHAASDHGVGQPSPRPSGEIAGKSPFRRPSTRKPDANAAVVRRTLIFPSEGKQATLEPGTALRKSSSTRRRRSTSAASVHSKGSVHDRVPTPPPPKSPTGRRFSAEQSPPLPHIPNSLLSQTEAASNAPQSASAIPLEKSNSAYDSLYEMYTGEGKPAISVTGDAQLPDNSNSNPNALHNLEPGAAVEVLELANGETIWSIVNGLRDDDEESFYGNRASFVSEYSLRDNEGVQVFFKEHGRKGSKDSQASFLSRKKPTQGAKRPETKVFFSSSAQIGRLIDNLSHGAESGSFNILPNTPTHTSRPSESSSAHWTVEERLEHMLNSLGTS